MRRHQVILAVAAASVTAALMTATVMVMLAPEPLSRELTIATAPDRRMGDDMWNFLMRRGLDVDGEALSVVSYAPDELTARLLVGCLVLTGHDAHTTADGGYTWSSDADDRAQFELDLARCRLAHPFPG